MRASTSAGPASLEYDVVDAPVGRDGREAALGDDEDERDGQPGRAEDLRECLRTGEVRACVEEDEIGFGRSDQLLRRSGDDPRSVRQ